MSGSFTTDGRPVPEWVDPPPPPSGPRSDIGQFAMVPVWMCSAGLTGGEFKTLVALLTWANREEGEAWPRVRAIADRAGLSESATNRALARLKELRIIETEQWKLGDGSIGGCNYKVFYVQRDPAGPEQTTPESQISPTAHSEIPASSEGECPYGTEPISL